MQPTSAIELAQALVRADTQNPPGGEGPAARILGGLLEEAGFSVGRHEFAPGRPSLVARLGGEPFLALTGHLDTVPADPAAWSGDPFSGEVSGGSLWGLGSSDMKSGVAALAWAALLAARRTWRGGGLLLVLTAGEETGCQGANHLAAQAGLLGRAGGLLVAEPTGARPWLGHKGALWLAGRTTGRAAHGSRPQEGDNAIYKAARAITRLAAHTLTGEHHLLGRPTFNLGTIKGGVKPNVVPAKAEFALDVRTVPGAGREKVMAELARVLGPEVELTPGVEAEPVVTDPDDPFARLVTEEWSRAAGAEPRPEAASYFTDGGALGRALGAPVVLLGPGEMAHQADEHCPLEQIELALAVYRRVLGRWLGC
jgi:succinyl-diaminopimelate desuccinylase